MRPKSLARMDFLGGQEWVSERFGRLVLCHGYEVQDLETGELLMEVNNDDDVDDIWDDFKSSMGQPLF